MRLLILFATIAAALGMSFVSPFAGVLTWVWYSLMVPQEVAYTALPINVIIAGVTLFSWFVSGEKKSMPGGLTPVAFYLFFAWMTLNSFVAVDPGFSWPIWNRVWKIYLMGFVAGLLTNSKVRFHALAWVIGLSLGYWGIKGGLFTVATGGHSHALGPEGSQLGDNNAFALAVVTVIPVLAYLQSHTANRTIRFGLVGAIVLSIFTVVGSYSRGGVISLAVLGIAFWLRAKNKIVYPIAAAIIMVPVLKFMPSSFWQRMDTVNQYQTDDSFQGRVDAWNVAWKYASAHFPFGAGFWAPQLPQVWNVYSPNTHAHAAHSIYFEVLGEHGFVGLFLFLVTIIGAFVNFRTVMVRTRSAPELRWANDLARMLQLSLFAFCVGGAALSMSYYDMLVLLIWMSVALESYTKPERVSLSDTSWRERIPSRPIAADASALGRSALSPDG